jgi:hypothetical protein
MSWARPVSAEPDTVKFRRFKMPEPEVPDVPTPSSPLDEASRDAFEKRLKGAYGDVDWSEADKDFLRASGLI